MRCDNGVWLGILQTSRPSLPWRPRPAGTGFRPLARREPIPHTPKPNTGKSWNGFSARWHTTRVQPENIRTSVMGEIGLAWGGYMEEFQEQGHPPERARVRFSKVLTKGARGWQVWLLYHRDIRPLQRMGATRGR